MTIRSLILRAITAPYGILAVTENVNRTKSTHIKSDGYTIR